MDGRSLAEHALEPVRIGGADFTRVQGPQSLLDLERTAERRLHGDLLIEREADQQRERFLGDERVGLVAVREVQALRGRDRHVSILRDNRTATEISEPFHTNATGTFRGVPSLAT